MHKELKGTDIQMVAEGYWKDYFRYHEPHNRANLPMAFGVVAGLVGLALLIIAAIVGVPNRPIIPPIPTWCIVMFGVGVALLFTAVGFLLTASATEKKETDKFLGHIIDQWENGDRTIPDIETVAEYLKNRDLGR